MTEPQHRSAAPMKPLNNWAAITVVVTVVLGTISMGVSSFESWKGLSDRTLTLELLQQQQIKIDERQDTDKENLQKRLLSELEKINQFIEKKLN